MYFLYKTTLSPHKYFQTLFPFRYSLSCKVILINSPSICKYMWDVVSLFPDLHKPIKKCQMRFMRNINITKNLNTNDLNIVITNFPLRNIWKINQIDKIEYEQGQLNNILSNSRSAFFFHRFNFIYEEYLYNY